MLRIDVDGRTGSKGYGIPASNPYVGEAGKNEIWQHGLRNPWRFSFDSATDNLWIGDVGQRKWEEIDRATDTASGPGRGHQLGLGRARGHPLPQPDERLQHVRQDDARHGVRAHGRRTGGAR